MRPIAVVLPLMLALGCTGGDVLNTGQSVVTLQVEVVNNGGYQGTNDFAIGKFPRMQVRPVDPAANVALGTLSINMIRDEAEILDLNLKTGLSNLTGQIAMTTTNLSAGTWTVFRVDMTGFTLFDADATLPAPDCAQLPIYDFSLVLLETPLTFTVSPSGSEVVNMRLDVGAMRAAVGASSTCDLDAGFLTFVDEAQLAALAPTFIALQ